MAVLSAALAALGGTASAGAASAGAAASVGGILSGAGALATGASGFFSDGGGGKDGGWQYGANKFGYKTQPDIARALGPYLWESLGEGLTAQEEKAYRGKAKTAVSREVESKKGTISDMLSSQGLRGGRVADILAGIDETGITSMMNFETELVGQDIKKKNKSIADLFQFLSLSAGVQPPESIQQMKGSKEASSIIPYSPGSYSPYPNLPQY